MNSQMVMRILKMDRAGLDESSISTSTKLPIHHIQDCLKKNRIVYEDGELIIEAKGRR